MKYVIVLIGSLCCATASDNRIGSAHIVNGVDHMLNVEIGISTRGQADVIITNIDAQEALFKAIRKDSVQGVRDAVRDGADVNQKIQDKTPLMWAVLLYRLQVTPELLQLGAVVDTECVCVAIKMRRSVAPVLVKHWNNEAYAQDTTRLLSEIWNFIEGTDRNPTVALECVRELIKKGVPLLFYVGKGFVSETIKNVVYASNKEWILELIKEVAVQGADIRGLWYAALCLGSVDADYGEEAAKFLLALGVDFNKVSWGSTPLYQAACEFQNKRIVQLLLAAGVDINEPADPFYGQTVLSSLIYQGFHDAKKQEMIELLLKYGAEL
jgi:hypothetical protein